MMRWDGTREGIERICAWANEGLHPFDDPFVTYEFTGPADVSGVVVATDDGDFTELHPWDLLIRTDDGFRIERANPASLT